MVMLRYTGMTVPPGEGLVELHILLLGPVELRAGDQRSSLGSTKERQTLAALAWDAGRTVNAEHLIRRIWDENPPPSARGNLHTYVSRLRTRMRSLAGPDAPALTRRSGGYVLEADPETIDARRYLALVEQARVLTESGGDREALRLLAEASRLWHGDPLAGLPGTWPEHIRGLLDEKKLTGALLRAGIGLRLGRFAEVVSDLAELTEHHATDETLIDHVALGLYGRGRTAEAERFLHRAMHRLRRENGTEPGARLRRVHKGILNRVPLTELLPTIDVVEQSDQAQTPVPDNLPHEFPWVGRRDEVAKLTGSLIEGKGLEPTVVSLEAIDGMPGVGKTSLAVHVAHQLRGRFPDGRFILDLRAQASYQEPMTPEVALAELLRQFGVPAPLLPQTLDELISMWRTMMASRRAIVILDNADGPEQVSPLLPGRSPTLVMITSRRRLTGIPGVRPLSLDVLTRSDAIALFRQRVGTERSRHESETATIVHLCGHLPLAIEMISSRYNSHRSWSTADLIDRLSRETGRLTEIRAGSQNIARVFEFSYLSLTSTQQMAFRHLGLHTGTEFGPHAAAALTGLTLDATEQVLEELNNLHLIQEPSPNRYAMHDLLREHARSLAMTEENSREAENALDRLLDFYLCYADAADRLVNPHRCRIDVDRAYPAVGGPIWPEGGDPQEWLMAESQNLIAILAYARRVGRRGFLCLLVHVLSDFMVDEGYLHIVNPLLLQAMDYWRDVGDQRSEAVAMLDSSCSYAHSGEYERAIESAQGALLISAEIADETLEAECLHQLGIPYWHMGQNIRALAFQRKALALRMAKQNQLQQARSLNSIGITLLQIGKIESALEYFHEALEKFQEEGDRIGYYRTLNNAAEAYKEKGDWGRAEHFYRKALASSEGVVNRVDGAILKMNIAGVLVRSGKSKEAIDLYRLTSSVFRSVGDKRNECIALNEYGWTLQLMGRSEEALSHHMASLVLARSIGAAQEEIRALRFLGLAQHRTGRNLRAVENLRAGLILARQLHAPVEQQETLLLLAEIEELAGARDEAERLRREALAVSDDLDRSATTSTPGVGPGVG
jgi:DNA-binding SARP family transcriptional activator/tetratricopeptide (TPR) repeat protein